MRKQRIDDVVVAMDRLSAAIHNFKIREKHDDHFRKYVEIVGFKETAAIRRASMDLTRALAKLRKP